MTLGLSPVPQRYTPMPVIRQDRPAYRIMAEKGFFGPDDCLYQAGSMIYWTDEPNQEMEPLNELAEKAMKAYLGRLDDEGRKVAEKIGKAYTSLADAYDNSRLMEVQDAKKIQLIDGQGAGEKPIMRAVKRGPKKIEAINAPEPVPQTGSNGRYAVNVKNEVDATDG